MKRSNFYLKSLVGLSFAWALVLSGCSNNPAWVKEPPAPQDQLPSWNAGVSKEAITEYVGRVTEEGSPFFVPEEDRIAVFDNDGTLWTEQPMYTEMVYSLEKAKLILEADPAFAKNPKLKDLASKEAFAANPENGILEAFALTHSGINADQFSEVATAWLDTAKHPKLQRKYTDLIYQPMVELLQYLRDNGFKTYIVTGGSSIFVRQFSEKAYGIPPEQVIGTMLQAEFVNKDGVNQVVYATDVWHNDDKAGKPVAIQQIIGKKPILAFGNSDGDLQMLQWTSTSKYKHLCLILHHTDADREYAYDRESKVGTLNEAWDEAEANKWIVVDMAKDFGKVFPN